MFVWLTGDDSHVNTTHQSAGRYMHNNEDEHTNLQLSFTKGCPRAQELAELARIALSTEARLSSRMAKQPWHFS